MTDDEILEKLREHFQTKVNNLSGDEMAEGPFEDPDETLETFGERWEAAAKVIDRRGGLRIRFEFGDADPTLAAADERQARAEAEARPHATRLPTGSATHPFPYISEMAEGRPHDGESVIGDVIKCQQCGQQTRSISRGCSACGHGKPSVARGEHVWMPYPDEPGRRCNCSIGHDHDEDPDDGPSQAQETRAAADWPAEPVDTRYDEQAADRG